MPWISPVSSGGEADWLWALAPRSPCFFVFRASWGEQKSKAAWPHAGMDVALLHVRARPGENGAVGTDLPPPPCRAAVELIVPMIWLLVPQYL